jgi:protein TonB
MQWSIIVSLTLHCGAAVILMYMSGTTTIGKHSSNLIIQNIELSSLSTQRPQLVTSPIRHESLMTPSQSQVQAIDIQHQEPSESELQPASTNNDKDGGITSTPLGLGMTHGYFTPLADGKSLRDDVRAYYLQIVESINREWWDKAALLKEPLSEDGIFEIAIQRDGTIEAQRILRRTGSMEADRLIAEIIRKASPLPPLPSTYEPDQFRAPLRIKAPLTLFRFKQ